MKEYLLIALAVSLLAACKEQPQARDEWSTQITERRVQAVEGTPKAFGEECEQGGELECESGVCIQTVSGFRCSQACSETACPQGWDCRQLFPAPGNDFCVPHEVMP